MVAEERLRKAINFFRLFQNKADKELYKKYILAFCSLVERYLNGEREWEDKKDSVEVAKEVFKDEIIKEEGDISTA